MIAWDHLWAYNLDRAQVPELKPIQQILMEQFGFAAILPQELDRIRVPTILIWGRHDLASPLPIAEAASVRYGWPLHVIDGAADDPPIEQPAAFIEVLRGVLLDANATNDEAPTGTREAWDRIAPGYDRTFRSWAATIKLWRSAASCPRSSAARSASRCRCTG